MTKKERKIYFKKLSGFSLVEVLLVISAMGILTGISTGEYTKVRAYNHLRQSSYSVVEVLQMAQNKAMHAENGQAAGVCFMADGRYFLVTGDSCLFPEATYSLSGATGFNAIHLPEDKVIFDKLKGGTAHAGNLVVNHPHIEDTVTITIDASGLIVMD